MRVIIIEPGVYNNADGQPVRCAKGDILSTAAGYGQTLLDSGLARPVLGKSEPAPASSKPKAIRRKRAAN
jgi:hypothetical protein